MKILQRLKSLERKSYPTAGEAQQAEMLDAFIEFETMIRGTPPTPEEIEDERRSLARPIKQLSKKERAKIAEEIEILFDEAARR